ncbi:MAG: cytochrome P450 [Hyphomicrobiales bacterium]|nr:cytochrome P450 [Hyphomicrobiales bacterium]
MDIAHTHVQSLGEAESVWFKLGLLTKETHPMQVLMRLNDRYGGCVPINLKDERIFFLSEVDYFEQVMVKGADKYGKYFDGLHPIFGNSMITIDGALWQKIRMPQQQAFTPKMFSEYLPYLLSSVKDKARDWERIAESGETVNLLEETWGLAASMICKAMFNREVPFNPQVIFRAVKTYTDVGQHNSIRMKKVNGATEVSSEEAAADAILKWLSVPSEVLGANPHDAVRGKSLLSILQEASDNPDQPEFNEAQIIDEMKQYLWAGTETTALTLAWCFYLLHLYPDVAARIRKEGEDAYGDRVPTWEDVHNLTYTRSVLQETMRLYPPIWSFIRQAVAEDEIGGHKVKPGDKMVMCAYIVHHHPKYWDDPDTFNPDRFLPENSGKRKRYSYLPFGAGKRSCIGGALSLVENTLALTQLLRRFRPEYQGEVPAGISATVTLTPENGTLPFKIRAVS